MEIVFYPRNKSRLALRVNCEDEVTIFEDIIQDPLDEAPLQTVEPTTDTGKGNSPNSTTNDMNLHSLERHPQINIRRLVKISILGY